MMTTELNNEAVKEMYIGNVSEAITMLSQGLQECRLVLDGFDESFTFSSVNDGLILDDWMSHTLAKDPSSGVYFYNEPIIILQQQERSPSMMKIHPVQTSIIVMFNLGLCYHQLALSSSSGVDKAHLLARSLACFQHSF